MQNPTDVIREYNDRVLSFCHIHNCYCPCMDCLYPEVMQLLTKYQRQKSTALIFIVDANLGNN